MTYSLIVAFLFSILAGLYSPFIVARRYAFLGEAIAHSTLLGFSLGLFIFQPQETMAFFLFVLLVTLLSSSFLCWSTAKGKLPSDTLIGMYLSVSLGAGLFIQSFHQDDIDFEAVLFGSVTHLSLTDLLIALVIFLLAIILFIIFSKRWILFCFDQEALAKKGLIHFAFFSLMTLIIVSMVKMTGPLLTNTLLIFPGAFAYLWSQSMKGSFIGAILFSTVGTLLGWMIFYFYDTLPGPTLTLTQFGLYLSSLMLKKYIARTRNEKIQNSL